MNERERLIELIENAPQRAFDAMLCAGATEAIADYLLANGVIVLPCKVGDTVYFVPYCNHIFELKVVRIATELIEEIGFSICCNGGWVFDNRYIGETVFFTREEAEKALAERSANNEK